MEALIRIQKELQVPKDKTAQISPQYSYNFRSAEGIMAAVKPLLHKATVVLTDEVKEVGTRIYIGATATIKEGELSESSTAWAREQETKRGLEAAQVTGGCSSYARKYALQGLFLLDDGSDPDSLPPDNAPPGPSPTSSASSETRQSPDQKAAAPQGQIPAPTPEQREWLKNLWGFYVAGSQGKLKGVDAKPMQEMMRLCQLHLQRYPGSMSDIELCKRYIKVEELIG